jgi:hypothetical protein
MTHSRSRGRLRHIAAVLAVAPLMTSLLAGAGRATASAAACQNWTGTQPPSPGAGSNELFGVAVLSACDAWAVGDDITSNGGRETLTEHWNGSSWTVVPSPDPASPDNVLSSVRAISHTNVWAVGYTASGPGDKTLILHWNGTRWKQVPSPNPGTFNRLYSVRAVSASDAWAVGFFSSGAGDKTLILHWNGTRWKQVPSPNPGGTGSDDDLFSVTATSRSDAWAVGETFASSKITTLIVRWNGRRWATVTSPSPGRSTELFGVAATSGSNAWAVGDATNGTAEQTLVLHWNGRRWEQVTSPNQGGSTNRNILVAATATAAKNAWAVGYFAHGTGQSTLILRWNGTKWTHVASPNLGASNILLAVAATSASNAWAVGSYRTSEPSQALAIHCC